jgi:hypothetical protein
MRALRIGGIELMALYRTDMPYISNVTASGQIPDEPAAI